MLYAGAVASGAFAGQTVTLFGEPIESTGWAVRAMALAGTIGYLLGSVLGWGIGWYGGRPYLERTAAGSTWARAARPGRGLVRALRRRVRPRRAGPSRRAFLHLHPGRRGRHAPGALHRSSASRAARSGASRSRASVWPSGRAGNSSTTAGATPTTSSSAPCSRAASTSPGGCARDALAGGLSSLRAEVGSAAVAIPLVDVRAQYAPLRSELERRIGEVLASGRFILGPEVRAFEAEAAAYLGVRETIGVGNGTDALVLTLDALGVGPGDEVICPAFTFFATAEAIARGGATPVFADIDPATLNLDPADVAKRVTDRTKAILAVHLFGRPLPVGDLPVRHPGRRGHRAGVRRDGRRLEGGRARDGRDVQLLPEQEPVRARRRGPRRERRRRLWPGACACFARTARATRRRSRRSATTRASTSFRRRRSAVPRAVGRLERRAP